MDVQPDKEKLFIEVYDEEHVSVLTSLPGVITATRSICEPLTLMLADKRRNMDPGNERQYSVTYEIENPRRPAQP